MSRSSQRGMALVITLIMLAVVTVMAVLFLGLSRRERVSVDATANLTGAKLAAEAAAARALAEMIGRIAANSNLFAYDLMVSTNYLQKAFVSGVAAYTNVSYTDQNGLPLSRPNDVLQNQVNLFYDPRPPVYVVTNDNTGSNEFRFYLDINRNGLYDTNGWQPLVAGQQIAGTNFLWGDPEWIGVLEHPDQPHSSSNRFIGRYAFVVLPAGKTLDLNFIHNSAKNSNQSFPITENYLRNQGAGSYEINLAAFFRDLNTNLWNRSSYTYVPGVGVNSGWAFEDALSVLKYRYQDNFLTLRSIAMLFAGTPAPAVFQRDGIDIYSDGEVMTGVKPSPEGGGAGNSDNTALPWSGSDNTNGYYSVYELLDPVKTSTNFALTRLRPALRTGNSYQRDTFSRLLAQLGTDSLPANRGKINLHYDNVDAFGNINPHLATNFIPWTPIRFFTNAADQMLRTQFPGLITITNIPLSPTNFYGGSVHRLLQLAANIGDAITNRTERLITSSTNHYAPSVFRPLFRRSATNIFVSGFEEVTNSLPLSGPWVDLKTSSTNLISTTADSRVNVYGVPWVIGAKKGFPNFNEFHLQTTVQVTRRLEAEKTGNGSNVEFHQLYEIGISNFFGLEAWNSYTQAYPGNLRLLLTNRCTLTLTDGTITNANTNYFVGTQMTHAPLTWGGTGSGQDFKVPLSNLVVFVPDSGWYPLQRTPLERLPDGEAVRFDRTPRFPVPNWKFYATNRLVYALIDTTTSGSERIVDFVNLDNQVVTMDINQALIGRTNFFGDSGGSNLFGAFWSTNRIGSGPRDPKLAPVGATVGITNQIYASFTTNLSDAQWTSYSAGTKAGATKLQAIHDFRVFLGYPGLPGFTNSFPLSMVRMQVPFTPTRKFDLKMAWQVNDPLVHYHPDDLYDQTLADTNNINSIMPPGSPAQGSNLGAINTRYRPWGGRPGTTTDNDTRAFNPTFKDPLIRRSDDWDFPTNKFPTLGWLGRVHRGTPWQTIYLKSVLAQQDINNALQTTDPVASVAALLNPSLQSWRTWAGRPDTHPITDWPLLQLFTVAPNDNAARGLLSVNQTNLAAWSAVLSGVSVLSNNVVGVNRDTTPAWQNQWIEPGSTQLVAIVKSINATRLAQPGQKFRTLGDVLASPALTIQSPFLNSADVNQQRYAISDAVYERIPQQILSLLKEDEAFVVIYAYGQSLKPAERSVVTAPGPYYNVCTNYQITGEVATKTAVRFLEFKQAQNQPSVYRAVVESYNILPTD